MEAFYEKLPQFRKTPFYIYGQSYGGKMAVDFAKLIYEVFKFVKQKKYTLNFQILKKYYIDRNQDWEIYNRT